MYPNQERIYRKKFALAGRMGGGGGIYKKNYYQIWPVECIRTHHSKYLNFPTKTYHNIEVYWT